MFFKAKPLQQTIMINQLPKITSKTDINVGFENNKNSRRLSEADILQLLKELNLRDVEAGKVILINAIKKGILLRSLKEQCKHGSWNFHLATLGINERKAQRLMTLANWEAQLLSENEKSIRKNNLPITVTRAFELAAAWSKLNASDLNQTAHTVNDNCTNDFEDFFEPQQKQKNDMLTITWSIKVSAIPQIIETLDSESQKVIETLKAILVQHTKHC
jgi:hypothetical protein